MAVGWFYKAGVHLVAVNYKQRHVSYCLPSKVNSDDHPVSNQSTPAKMLQTCEKLLSSPSTPPRHFVYFFLFLQAVGNGAECFFFSAKG